MAFVIIYTKLKVIATVHSNLVGAWLTYFYHKTLAMKVIFFLLKFRLSEKATKFLKNLTVFISTSYIVMSKRWEIFFFKFCGFLRMSELYISGRDKKSLLQNIASKLRNPLKDAKLDETYEDFQKKTNSYKGMNIKKVLY